MDFLSLQSAILFAGGIIIILTYGNQVPDQGKTESVSGKSQQEEER